MKRTLSIIVITIFIAFFASSSFGGTYWRALVSKSGELKLENFLQKIKKIMAKKDELAASVSLKKEFAMLQKSNADQAEKLATALGVTEVALYELSFLQLLLDSLVTDILPQFKELTPEATLHGQIDRIGKQVFSFKEIISPEMFDAVEQWKNKISSGDAVVKEATDSLSVQSRPRGIAVSTEPV